MKKIALFLIFVLCLGMMTSFAVFAEVSENDGKSIEIINPGFEIDQEKGWGLSGGAFFTDEYYRSGKCSLSLRNVAGGPDAQAMQTVTGIKKGATYEISAWLLNPENTEVNIGYWLYFSSKDFYDWNDSSTQLGIEKGVTRWNLGNNGHFQRFAAEFIPPEGTKSILIAIRHRQSPGAVYLDDMEIYMSKEPNAIDANTDEVFYYTEWETGSLTGIPNMLDDAENASAEIFLVTPDGTETHKETVKDLSKGLNYEFRTEWMEEKGKRYHIRLKVYDSNGTSLQEQDFPVFRFDRPTYLGADGVFRKNGKEYTFAYGAGVREDYLEMHPEAGGVTIVQLISPAGSSPLLERMDKAYEQGLLVLVNLYYLLDCAGSDSMLDNTIKVVNEVKDHPALFGYFLQDEPYQKGNTDEEMIRGYETIRNIDPHHPVYASDSVSGGYEWMFRYCDIFDTAYYYGSHADAGRKTGEVMDIAMLASKGRKPFTVVLQAFPMNGYLPTVDQLRHMAYQSFFSGGSGYQFFSLGIAGTDGGNTAPYLERPEWQEIVDTWAKWERDFMFGCFVTGEYKFVNYVKSDDVLWASFTDGKDIYIICLNREKFQFIDAEITLKSGDGTLAIDAYTAVRMTGKEETVTGNRTLSISMEPWEAVVWKVTPEIAFDASQFKSSKFNDTIYYPWAYNAIANLEEKGIINKVSDTWFGPGQNITRGDYAMFLVRALGLEGAPSENFVDVDANAEYAKELAIGKAAGILQGVGDNKFNPEDQVTRQDMMTMTSRAMSLAGTADLTGFPDNGSIADYAKAHVSAMVAEGLIKGNADGTINPLGNTTRAEAAVIMNRIIAK